MFHQQVIADRPCMQWSLLHGLHHDLASSPDFVLLVYAGLTGTIPPSIAKLPGLKHLYLSFNRLTGNLHKRFCTRTDDPLQVSCRGPLASCKHEAGLLHGACSMQAAHENTGILASAVALHQAMQSFVGCTGCTVQHQPGQGCTDSHSSVVSAGADPAFKHAQRHGRLHSMYQSAAAGPDGKLPLRDPPWPLLMWLQCARWALSCIIRAHGCAYP